MTSALLSASIDDCLHHGQICIRNLALSILESNIFLTQKGRSLANHGPTGRVGAVLGCRTVALWIL
jgi:hypothetical protein